VAACLWLGDNISILSMEKWAHLFYSNTYGAHCGYKSNIFFMNFGLPIYPLGLGIMRKEILLDSRIKGGIFDGFGNQASDGVNRVFIKSFVSGGKKLEQFRIIIIGIHNDSGITFFYL
jgi:hypothetical protein